MGDLPDWTTVTSNQGIVINDAPLAASASWTEDVSAYQSITVLFTGTLNNTALVLLGILAETGTSFNLVDFFAMTSVAIPSEISVLPLVIPVTAPFLTLQNESTQPVDLIVIGTSKPADVLHVAYDRFPGREFAVAGNFVNGTPVQLAAADGGPGAYASNGQCSIIFGANTNGAFAIRWVDASGTLRAATIQTLAANASANLSIALPQGMIGFEFIPSAGNASGSAFLTVSPAV